MIGMGRNLGVAVVVVPSDPGDRTQDVGTRRTGRAGGGGPSWRRWTAGSVLGLYLALLGFLCGIALERIQFDSKRHAVLAGLDAARGRVHERLMALEHHAMTRPGETGAIPAR